MKTYKLPLKCVNCDNDLTVLEVYFNKDIIGFTCICVSCGTEIPPLNVSYEELIKTAILYEIAKDKGNGKSPC